MINKKGKIRIDTLLLELGKVKDAKSATALLMSGAVFVGGKRITSPGESVYKDAVIEIIARLKYVSRGGNKIEGAVDSFGVEIAEKICMDVGASTGGFTDFLIQRGAKKVYALDVGRNLLHEKLRHNPRVVLLEGVNFKYFNNTLPDAIELITVDVSFISIKKILTKIKDVFKQSFEVIALVKPQFEASPAQLRKGVVIDGAAALAIANKISQFAMTLGFELKGQAQSPLRGAKGNREYFIHLRR